MIVSDTEIERLADDLIAEHGSGAARVAAERLNEMIDRDNSRAGELWACVVHLIHQRQGTGPTWDAGAPIRRDRRSRLAPV